MRRYFLSLAILLNVLLVATLVYGVQRLGGWRYSLYRLQHSEAGLYAHRKNLFDELPTKPNAIILLGDSQIEQCEWRELLGDSLPVLNRGITGDHTQGVLERLEEVLRHRPATVFLCVGVNDLLFGKTLPKIEARYREIVKTIRQGAPGARLVLISVLPVNAAVKNINLENAEVRILNEKIESIARENALGYLNLYTQVADDQGNLRAGFTDDGIHLNAAGYLEWKIALEPFLK